MSAAEDTFAHLARYYDPLMDHVDYTRWARVCAALAELAPAPLRHLDAGCGTGVLVSLLREDGWNSTGIDYSLAMLQSARGTRRDLPVAHADLRALPFHGAFGLISCLFDSLNFLLEEAGFRGALRECADALAPGGVLYFDVVTERMVVDHFADQEWYESNTGFTTRWSSTYEKATGITESRIRVNHGEETIIRERVYANDVVEDALRAAGLTMIALVDGHGWGKPTRQSTRLDFIAMKNPPRGIAKKFERVRETVRALPRIPR